MKSAHVALLCCALITSASAEVGSPRDIAALTRGAGTVVIGHVVDIEARFATNGFGDQLIVSTATLDVLETLKGPARTSVRVSIEGGTVGDLTLKVSDMPSLRSGDRGVFFLDAEASGEFRPRERGRGILRLSASDRVEGSALTLGDVRSQVANALGRGPR
jgi:hypothetical protein